MPIEVMLPDGSVGQFPDGMADADIERVLRQQFGAPEPPSFANVQGKVASTERSFAAGTDIPTNPDERIVGHIYKDRQGNPRRWGDGAWLTADESRETTLGELAKGYALKVPQGLMAATRAIVDTGNLALNALGTGMTPEGERAFRDSYQEANDYYEQQKPAAFRAEQNAGIVERDGRGNIAGLRAPSAESVGGALIDSAAQLPAFVAGGAGLTKLAEAGLKNSPRLAAAIGYGGTNAALIAPSQRQDTIADAERLGMSPEAAREAGNNAGLMTAGLTALTGGAGGLMSKLTGASANSLPSALARGFVAEAPFEGVEGAGQSAIGDVALGREVNAANALDAGLLAGLTGGLPGSAIAGMEYAGRPVAPPQVAPPVTPSEAVAGPLKPAAQRGEAMADAILGEAKSRAVEIVGGVPATPADIANDAAIVEQFRSKQAQAPGTVTRIPGGGYRIASEAGPVEFTGPDAFSRAGEFAVRVRAEAAARSTSPEVPAVQEPQSSAVDPVANPAPVAAPIAGPEAGAIIDRRLAALDEAAAGALSRGQFAALRREGAELGARLRQHEEIVRSGIVPADPRAKLRDAEIEAISQRRMEIHAAMERSRAAAGSAEQAAALRARLERIDGDAQLVALAKRLRGPVPADPPSPATPARALPAEPATASEANFSGNVPSRPLTQLTQAPSVSSVSEQNVGATEKPAVSAVPAIPRDAAPIGELPEQRAEVPAAPPVPPAAAAPSPETVSSEKAAALPAVPVDAPAQGGDGGSPAASASQPQALDEAPAPTPAPSREPAAIADDADVQERVARSLSKLDEGAVLINQGSDYRVAKVGDDVFLIGTHSAKGGRPRRVPRAEAEAFLREQYAPEPLPTSRTETADTAEAEAADLTLRSTGTKNAITDAERAAAGRDPILRDAVKGNEDTLAEAMRTLKSNPDAGQEAVARSLRAGAEGVSLADSAILLVHKTDLLNRRDAAAKKLADPDASEEAKEVARRAWADTEAQVAELDQAASNMGTEAARLLQFRQRMLREDFTFAALERKERARLERPLTQTESATIKAMADTIAEMQAKVDALQARIANAESEGAYEDLVKRMAHPKRAERLEHWRKRADAARARLKAAPEVQSRNRQSGAVVSPALLLDILDIGTFHAVNGIDKLGDWVAAMKADFGERFDDFKAEHPRWFKASRARSVKPLKADATVAEVMEKIDAANVTSKDVRKLVEALVGEGLRGEQAVIAAAAEKLELEASDVRRLFAQASPKAQPTLTEVQVELRDLRKLVRLQAEIDRITAGAPKPARGPAPPDSPAVAEKKRQLAELRASLKPVRDPEGRYQEMRGKQIAKRIKEIEDRIRAGDFAARPRVPRKLNEANQRAQYELDKAKDAFAEHQFREMLKARSKWGKALGYVGDTFNLSRAVMTSMDWSGVGRQGGFITYAHPLRASKSLLPMLRAMFSEEGEHAVMREIQARPNAPLYRKYKLALTSIGQGSLNKVEEAYAARWLDKLPNGWKGALIGAGIGALQGGPVGAAVGGVIGLNGGGFVRGSGRGYVAFLNKLRADSFDAMAATMTRTGVPTEAEAKHIADFVNTATGRGKIWGGDSPGEIANATIFAPRLVASRFSLATFTPIFAAPTWRMRRALTLEYARTLAGYAVAVSLVAFAMSGDDEEDKVRVGDDVRSSDFGKIVIGNTRIDLLMGLSQPTVFMMRLILGETKTKDGEIRPLRPKGTWRDFQRWRGSDLPPHEVEEDGLLPFGAKDAKDVFWDFVRSKLAPASSAAFNLVSGSDFMGRPVTPGQQALEMVMPMSFGDIADAMEDRGVPQGAVAGVLSLFGASLQVHLKDEAERAQEVLGAVDTARAELKERLAAAPAEKWADELAAMKAKHGALLEDAELKLYADNAENRDKERAGEVQLNDDGSPKLEYKRITDPEKYNANYREQLESQGLSVEEIEAAEAKNQVHHIIPDNVMEVHPLMVAARAAGYDPDNRGNLIGLTGKRTKETDSGVELGHRTDHPKYDLKVVAELNAAEKQLVKDYGSLENVPKAELLDAIRKVEAEMRSKIEQRDVPIKDGRLANLPVPTQVAA